MDRADERPDLLNRGVAILFNQPGGEAVCAESDAGVLLEVEAVSRALDALGIAHRRAGVRRLTDLPPALEAGPERLVFNLVERLDGAVTDFNQAPAVCEALGRGCTGNSAECLSLTLDKWLTKARLQAGGVGVPPGIVAPHPGATEAGTRRKEWQPPTDGAGLPLPPWFVKPLCTDASEGIDAARSLVRGDGQALAAAVRAVHEQFGQAALVEAFVEGREFNLSVIERDGVASVLPLAEIDFALFPEGRPHVVDYAVKWIQGTIPGRVSPRRVPAPVDERTADYLRDTALKAWRACGCRDYARVDLRLSPEGLAHVLEINANPDISPMAGLPACLAAAGIAFPEFIRQMLRNAAQRLLRP